MEAFENEQVFEFIPHSTDLPEILKDGETTEIVAIIVIAAILLITLLFCIAIFIDCRQQKLVKMKQMDRARKINKLKIPSIKNAVKPAKETDQETIVDKMQEQEISEPPV